MSRPTEKERQRAREYQRWLRAEKPEQVKAAKKAYYEQNKERCKEKSRAHYAANREHHRKMARRKALAKLGTTPEERAAVLVAQNGLCAICQQPFRNSTQTHTDHDHETGLFRALLCNGCNHGLGIVERDGGHWLWAACAYLVRHGHPGFTWVYEPEDLLTPEEMVAFRSRFR